MTWNLVEVGHLDGAGHVVGVLLVGPGVLALLASHQVAVDAALVGLVEDLDGEHLEGAAVDAGLGVGEPLQGVVRLAWGGSHNNRMLR